MRWKTMRPLLGITLIVLAILAMVWWERSDREQLVMESIMVAKENIKQGTVVREKDFLEIKNIPQSTIPGAITPQTFYKINGHVANQNILKLAQVVPSMFTRRDKVLLEDRSIFAVKDSWIDSRSSSLRKGDEIDIYDNKGQFFLGTFDVAYVKDADEQEVVGTEENFSQEILERDFSSSVIAHVEIITSLDTYRQMWELAEGQGMKFLLVQKGENVI